jgi:Dyp-type peroxidase family
MDEIEEEEPVLAAEEIQGNVLPGFGTRHQALLFLEIVAAPGVSLWLGSLPISTLADLLEEVERPGRACPAATPPWTNVAISYAGLAKLIPDADRLTDAPLKQGLAARSHLLGDPLAEDAPGNCRNWVIGRPGQPVDVVLIVGHDDAGRLDRHMYDLARRLPASLRVVYDQRGGVLPPPLEGREPFGFCDPISQPGIRGRLPGAGAPLSAPRDKHNLVWPGEFVFGYPAQNGADRRRAGPIARGGPPWARNGSLLVFRRLRQDVQAFDAFVRAAAETVGRAHPNMAGTTPELLAAKLMGRWRSGAPLIHHPQADAPAASNRNDFRYLEGPGADPLGVVCPRAAHIRRAYPRDEAKSSPTTANIETHRLLRRGVPFVDCRDGVEERGLLFLAYQTSIERQFEFVQRAWLNNPHLHDRDDGHDPIVGQAFGNEGSRSRIFTVPVRTPAGEVERVTLDLPHDWVVPTGGGYFFVPSVSALRELAA